jgi:hypothetical protein|eukprot:COSAG02_NODE_2146_length_9670_cov_7.714136_2_plen_167_part_00
MSTLLFEGHQEITRGDAVAFPKYRSASDRKRSSGVAGGSIRDQVRVPVPPVVPARDALSAAMALRPVSAPRPLPPPAATEWSGRLDARLTIPDQPVRRNLDDYALTGLSTYRPPGVIRNPMGWIDVDGAGGSASSSTSDTSSTGHVMHVRFSHSGSPRPVGEYDVP